jgi:hypothetical protein
MHLIRARDFMQITVSNLEALSMFVLRVHGKKTANGAGYTGPIRKMTSPAMTAAVLRTKTGALSPLQHVLQVQKAKISALRSVVKRLQDGRPPEHHTSPTKRDQVRVNFLSKRVENELSSPASDEESSLQHQGRSKSPSQTRSILPSVRQAQELAERQSHLKNQYNWRRLADIQVIQATAEPASTTTGGGHAHYPSGGNPPASPARAWTVADAEQKAWEKCWHAGAQTLYPSQQPRSTTSDSQRFPVARSTTIRATLQLSWTSVGGDGSTQRVAFRNFLQQDLANASGLPPSSFVIQRLFPGSVIVVCDIHADPSHRGPVPESAAIDLLKQAGNPISVLRSGSLTRFITDFAISGSSSPLNHNTDFAARLVYSPRSDVHGANGMPERASLTTSSPPAPPGSIISIRPLGKTFGSELRDFEGTLHLEIGTSHPVRSLYYTLNGSDPTPDYYVGSG